MRIVGRLERGVARIQTVNNIGSRNAKPGIWARDRANGAPMLISAIITVIQAVLIFFAMRQDPSGTAGMSAPLAAILCLIFVAPAVVAARSHRFYFLWGNLPDLLLPVSVVVAAVALALVSKDDGSSSGGGDSIWGALGIILAISASMSALVSVPRYFIGVRRSAAAATAARREMEEEAFTEGQWPPSPKAGEGGG